MKLVRTFILTNLLLTTLACRLDANTLPWVHYTAQQFGLDANLFEAVIRQESSLCLDAGSDAGAIGLGQLMPTTATDLGVNPYDPAQNLWGAAYYLRQQYETFGNWELALAAYNAGPNAVVQTRRHSRQRRNARLRQGGVSSLCPTRSALNAWSRWRRQTITSTA